MSVRYIAGYMIGKESKEGKVVPINAVIEILEERKKSGDLTYEQQIALEHSKKFAQTKAQNEKTKKALEALGTLNTKSVFKILEIMPRNAMLLKQILMQEKKTFSEDDIKNILAITREKG